MGDVNDLVNEVVAEENERRLEGCRKEIKSTVFKILENELKIKQLTTETKNLKDKLKELQAPEAVTLEL